MRASLRESHRQRHGTPHSHHIRRAGFTPLGWFAPTPEDRVPDAPRFVILIGNAGPTCSSRFARERDPGHDAMDDWTREVVEDLARDLDARALYPFDMNPPWPFSAGRGAAVRGTSRPWPQHPPYHSGYARLSRRTSVPRGIRHSGTAPRTAPLRQLRAKPCLTACPVGAFDGTSYDVPACARHIATPAGEACMGRGCLARHACPVGQGHAYARHRRVPHAGLPRRAL